MLPKEFILHGHSNACENRLILREDGYYDPVTKWRGTKEDSYIRVGYGDDKHIEFLDFEGGPLISIGYKLNNNYSIKDFVFDKSFNTIKVLIDAISNKSTNSDNNS